MKYLDLIVTILLIIGGLNWGFIGLFDFNVVEFLLGWTGIVWLIYLLVGLSALWQCYSLKQSCTC